VGSSLVTRPLAGLSTNPEAGRIETENEPSGSGPRKTNLSSEPSGDLRLNCLVFGYDSGHVFTVRIEGKDNISLLKDAIKDKLKPAFDHVAAKTLKTWSVCIAVDDNDFDDKVKREVESKVPLLCEEIVASLFGPTQGREPPHCCKTAAIP
jgi:hypothetical protein